MKPLERTTKVFRDLLLVLAGVCLTLVEPASVAFVGLSTTASVVWGASMVAGGCLSLYGHLRERVPQEIYGCMLVAFTCLYWGGAAVLSFRELHSIPTLAVGAVVLHVFVTHLLRAYDAARGETTGAR